jgi:hypothetical protein
MNNNKDFINTTNKFIEFVNSLNGIILDYRPQIDFWTIRENILHVCDSEVNAYLRLKTILAEPGKETYIINEELWTKNIDNYEYDLDEYIGLFKIIRGIELRIINSINSKKFSNNYVLHKDYGRIDISTWIDWYSIKHVKDHLNFMERNLGIWKENL